MPSGGRPTVPRPWSSSVVHVPGPGLGRAVALEDRDAEVLPAPAGGPAAGTPRTRGTAGSGRRAARGRCRTAAAGSASAGAGRSTRSRSNAAVRPRFSTSRSMALQNRSRTCGHDDHRGDAVVAQRIEDDPRVAAADVQDVGPDVERVVQPDRLLEQVRQRQQRHEPVLHRRDDPVERLDRGDDVVVGRASRPSGVPVVPDVKTSSNDLVRRSGAPRPPGAPPSRAGRPGRPASGSAQSASTVVVGKSLEAGLARVGGVAARAQDEVPGARTPSTMPSTASGDIRRSSGTRTSRAAIAP